MADGLAQYLLFVSADPDGTVPPLGPAPVSSLYRMFVPLGRPPPTAPPARGTEVLGEQARCARLVLDLADRAHRTVRVVNVSQPGNDTALVARHVGAEPCFPIPVSPDGRRLEGEWEFLPSTVKRFLAGR